MLEFNKITIQTDYGSSDDITAFILALPEPEKSICHALIIRGDRKGVVAKRYQKTTTEITRLARSALLPIGLEYDIQKAIRKVTDTKKVTDIRKLLKNPEINKRYYQSKNHKANHRGSTRKT